MRTIHRAGRSRWLGDESGVTSIEYALLGSLIAAVVSGTVAVFGNLVGGLFGSLQWW